MKIKRILSLIILLIPLFAYSQQTDKDYIVNYEKPQKYIIGGVDVAGVKYLGKQQVLALTGLTVGKEITIPSDQTSSNATSEKCL